jgi:hypothetical protein
MISKTIACSALLAAGMIVGLASAQRAYAVAVNVNAVGTYAPNPNALTIVNATSNSNPNGITLANFQTLVANAFTANLGGVINAEPSGGWLSNGTTYGDGAANVISASYGASLANVLTLYRSDLDGSNTPIGINANTNNGTNVVSGTAYLGIVTSASPVNLVFGSGLSALGLTEVPRGAIRVNTLTAMLDNGTTIAGSTEAITEANAPGAIFWGFQAPVGRTIVGLNIVSTDGATAQFSRYDDLGFVVAVPEPTSFALLGIGCAGLLMSRLSARKFRKGEFSSPR